MEKQEIWDGSDWDTTILALLINLVRCLSTIHASKQTSSQFCKRGCYDNKRFKSHRYCGYVIQNSLQVYIHDYFQVPHCHMIPAKLCIPIDIAPWRIASADSVWKRTVTSHRGAQIWNNGSRVNSWNGLSDCGIWIRSFFTQLWNPLSLHRARHSVSPHENLGPSLTSLTLASIFRR